MTAVDLLTDAEIGRFWSKVQTGTTGDCWQWSGELNNHGYGRFAIWSGGRRSRLLAHRVAYQLRTGCSLGTSVLLHACDNPPCCNPGHLMPGTQAENVADARVKGRATPPPVLTGEQCPSSKLSAVEVQDIRERYAHGNVSQEALATEYDVSQKTVSLIVRGLSWRTLLPRIEVAAS